MSQIQPGLVNRRQRSEIRSQKPFNGILLLDKPAGLSSNQALQRVRRLFKEKTGQKIKAGHTGTLDPMATGLLPLVLGEGTKFARYLIAEDKSYQAQITFGATTTTGDMEGEILHQAPIPPLNKTTVEKVFTQSLGPQHQTPPIYSAIKYQGKPLYEYARQGIEVPLKSRQITIHNLRLLELTDTSLRFEAEVSKGTYIRSLAESLSQKLGTLGHLTELRRLSVGPFKLNQAVTLEKLTALPFDKWPIIPIQAWLNFPQVTITQQGLQRLTYGQPLKHTDYTPHSLEDESLVQLLYQNTFVGLGLMEKNKIQPKRLLSHLSELQ